ncbi:MAG: hypothetical protein H3C27_01165 [Opitutaceae bacterium]|nr:hypothetical protein [Opitutaceae bacterium]
MKNARDLQRRSERHRWILTQLSELPKIRQDYNYLLLELGMSKDPPTKEDWTAKWQPLLRNVGSAIAQGEISAASEEFLRWPEGIDQVDGQDATRRTVNRCRIEVGGTVVNIQLGSIHSVKGETHTATLVCETYYYKHNLSALRDWILGKMEGEQKKTPKLTKGRLKLHYVAMTRPSHLLCLAMPRTTFEANGQLDVAAIAELASRGWSVVET